MTPKLGVCETGGRPPVCAAVIYVGTVIYAFPTSSVVPGPAEGRSPESITPTFDVTLRRSQTARFVVMDSGLAGYRPRPGMTGMG